MTLFWCFGAYVSTHGWFLASCHHPDSVRFCFTRALAHIIGVLMRNTFFSCVLPLRALFEEHHGVHTNRLLVVPTLPFGSACSNFCLETKFSKRSYTADTEVALLRRNMVVDVFSTVRTHEKRDRVERLNQQKDSESLESVRYECVQNAVLHVQNGSYVNVM